MLKRRLLNDKPLKLYTKRFYPAGTYTWIVPPGCTEVDVFLVGAGGGAGGYTTNWGPNGAGGVACFVTDYSSGGSSDDIGSRIQYRGPIQVIEDPAEFIALPVGF